MNAPIQSTPGNTRSGVRAPSQSAPASPAKPPSISSGRIQRPLWLGIYGAAGVGKTTLAAEAPAPIFLDLDDGSSELNVSRFDGIETWPEVLGAVRWMITGEHDFKTIVFDTVDKMEWLCHQHLCHTPGDKKGNPVSSIEYVASEEGKTNFGRGHDMTVVEFRRLFAMLHELRRKRGMTAVFISHGKIASGINPDAAAADFNVWDLKCGKKLAGLFLESLDGLFYAHRPVAVAAGESQRDRDRGYLDKERLLGVESTGGYVAKNRFGLTGTVAMNWRSLTEAMGRAATPDAIIASIRARIAGAESSAVGRVEASIAAAVSAGNTAKLHEIDSYLAAKPLPRAATTTDTIPAETTATTEE